MAKNYDSFVKAIEERRFDKTTHNKAIQKAVESYRVKEERGYGREASASFECLDCGAYWEVR